MKSFSAVALFLFAAFAVAQTPTQTTGLTFSTTAGAAGVCLSGQCDIGSLSIESLGVTQSLSVGSSQLIAPTKNMTFYGGDIRYSPSFDSFLTKHTLIPAHTIQFALHGGPGVLNNTSTVAPGTPHVGALVIADIGYAPLSDGHFIIAGQIGGLYAPGFAATHFGQVYSGSLGYLFGGTKPAGVSAQARRVWGTKK